MSEQWNSSHRDLLRRADDSEPPEGMESELFARIQKAAQGTDDFPAHPEESPAPISPPTSVVGWVKPVLVAVAVSEDGAGGAPADAGQVQMDGSTPEPPEDGGESFVCASGALCVWPPLASRVDQPPSYSAATGICREERCEYAQHVRSCPAGCVEGRCVGEWRAMSSPRPRDLYAVWSNGPEDVWVGGTEVLAHFDGLQWRTDPFVPEGRVHQIRTEIQQVHALLHGACEGVFSVRSKHCGAVS